MMAAMPRLVFDFPDADPSTRSPARAPRVVFRDPVEVVSAFGVDQLRPAMDRIQEATGRGLHAAGYLSYEAAPGFDPAMRVRPGSRLPLLWFGLFNAPTASPDDSEPLHPEARSPALDWRTEMSEGAHAAAVGAIREAIADGQTYQVNLTTRLRAAFSGDPWLLYQELRRAQGPGYHAYLDLGRHVIVSVSPELFFRTRGRRIITRPMKGTRPRGRWCEEDEILKSELRSSCKDRGENLMIVDLLRNDLGRICQPGSVHVPGFQEVERYRTVWQMVSTVEGQLREELDLSDLFTALFPCGSVTGAPKVSTMDEIARHEVSPREVYCGAIGWVRPGRDAIFNVPIRTAWLDRESCSAEYGTGGGVVWDSTPGGEYDELSAKTVVIREAWPGFALLETLGLHEGSFSRRERHVQRMRRSADYFGFPDPLPAVEAALDQLARRHPAGSFLARVTFGANGAIQADADPMVDTGSPDPPECGPGPSSSELPHVVLATSAVDSSDRFLFHKTTHRAVHDFHRERAPGAFDVLLYNERGEITEFTRGNVVLELKGRLLTPPQSAGLLAGCLRGELLEEGRITASALRPEDLGRAHRIWRINSARGWIEVRLTEEAPG